jgi:hypothetical protein
MMTNELRREVELPGIAPVPCSLRTLILSSPVLGLMCWPFLLLAGRKYGCVSAIRFNPEMGRWQVAVREV